MIKGPLKLQSPWVIFAEEIKELFREDPEIHIEYKDDNPYEIKLFVDNAEKADALAKLIPQERVFGNVIFHVTIVPADNEKVNNYGELFEKAFAGNPALSFVAATEPSMFTIPATYVVFANKVVQFYTDDLSDYYRNRSTLYENIAEDVFGTDAGVFFCTDRPAPQAEEDDYDEETDGDPEYDAKDE